MRVANIELISSLARLAAEAYDIVSHSPLFLDCDVRPLQADALSNPTIRRIWRGPSRSFPAEGREA
jgi:hypothetical protein